MRDQLSLAPVPIDEPCAQLGDPDYPTRARKECRAFINQLVREFGEPPSGARLKITQNPHDFGTYLDVEVLFDDSVEEAAEWAYTLEAGLPLNWDAAALEELKEPTP